MALVKHDLKKYCPSEALWNNQAQKRKPVNRISQTGFVFNTQAMKNNSEVLKSRYGSENTLQLRCKNNNA